MFGFGRKKGPFLGLDINGDSITLIQLEKTRAGIEVARFACQPTPPNTIREGLIADPQTVGNVVMELLAQANIPPAGPSPTVNVSVPAQAVVIRLLPVPTGMPPEELADVVTQEATNHVPFPIEDANLDWSQMPATERTDADGVRRIDVILAAVQRSIIETYWRMADSAGVRLGRVDISSLSVIRSLALAGYLGSSGHLSMIVNIRHDAADINIVRSAMPLFGRSIMLGMDTITESLSRSLEIHFDQALDLLPEITLYGTPPDDEKMGHAAQITRTVFSDIADELQRSLEFYKSQVGDVKVDQVILTGPGCMIPLIDQFFSGRMNIRTIVADPMRDMVFDNDLIVDRMRPILAALIGSSIEPTWNPSFTVDLDLNKEGRLPLLYDERATQVIAPEERPTPWFKPLLLGSCCTLAAMGAATLYISHVDIPAQVKAMEDLKLQIALNNKQLAQITKLRQTNSILSLKKRLLDSIVKKSKHWSDYLETVRHNVPPGVHIDEVLFDENRLRVEGAARDFTDVSKLAVNLTNEPLFRTATVEWAARNEQHPNLISFAVVADIGASNDMADATAANRTAPPTVPSELTGETAAANGTLPDLASFAKAPTGSTTDKDRTNSKEKIPTLPSIGDSVKHLEQMQNQGGESK